MDKFFAAWRFLTVLPAPNSIRVTEAALAGSLPYFPLIGLLVGLVGGLLSLTLLDVFPVGILAVSQILVLTAVSGGMHMDGLADTADGFFSARPKERVLAIMKDSRIGTMGVVAVVFVVLFKLFGFMAYGRSTDVWVPMLLVPLAGRMAMVVMIARLPYVRAEGLGRVFYQQGAGTPAVWAVCLLSVLATIVDGWKGLAMSAACFVFVLVFAQWCRARIGGATGDTMGAACELAETLAVVLLATMRL